MAHLTQRRGKSVHASVAQDYNGGTATAVVPGSPKPPNLTNGSGGKLYTGYADDSASQDEKHSPLIDYSVDEQRDVFNDKGLPAYKHGLAEDETVLGGSSSLSSHFEMFMYAMVAFVAGVVRFYKIWHPTSVVFDEVHFGKFASYYLRREYFFDVHPPLAKLLLAFAGWLIGYDGSFEFENIGDDYLKNNVPYIGLRALPAICGSLTPAVMYGIMRESAYPRIIALLSASLVAFDNAHVTQTRLILLDAPMLLFQVCALYCYIRFYKLRYREFSTAWWSWMVATGIFLALTLSCKMVGLFIFLTVGCAVCVDLWNILDIRRGNSIHHVARHFAARVLGLILIPACVYMFWFWVHFRILSYSGTGDDFMSPAFQETLKGSPLTVDAAEIRYYDTLTIRHRQTKVYLHSHPDRYPLQYEDGRISSQGQQVTGYPFNDTNNHWIVEPTRELPETGRERVVRHDDIVRLYHPNTQSYLMTHDVACPLMATNEEFTTWPKNDTTRANDTTFRIEIDDGHAGQQWMSKSGHFRLLHIATKVAMWTRASPVLPDWGFKQQEINGHKNLQDVTNIWFVDDIIKDDNTTDAVRPPPKAPKQIKHINFFKKFFELQILMIQHNAGLTDSHPYASGPVNWPFLLSGISFWTGTAEDRGQVYLIGNFIDWWFAILALSVFLGILGAEQLARRRGIHAIPEHVRNRLYSTGGFFLLGWAFHYGPFWTMNRQLFLHHYLPAHIQSALVAGVAFNFVFSDTVNFPASLSGPKTRRRPQLRAEVPLKMVVAAALTIAAVIGGFIFMAPLTYGHPGLDVAGVNRRRILDSWSLHFAK